ncbi:MAG: glycosyltransferase family 4 protein [Flavobacteriales bacterium]
MKIVILSNWFSERMGYIENCLSKSLAKTGHEIHVVSSTAQVYYNLPEYKTVYEPFIGKNIQEEGVKQLDGYTLHRIPFISIDNKVCFKKLGKKLREIKPDVVQVFDAFSFTTFQAAWYKFIFGYKLFTANHTVASVFPLYQKGRDTLLHKIAFFLTRTAPGTVVSWCTSMCFPPTIDAQDIAENYYGIPRSKMKMVPLGVDTDFFCPAANTDLRKQKREALGVGDNEILVIYTGRFTDGKDPLCLAKAIDKLVSEGEPFKALFMGNGPQLEEIKKRKGCITHKFVPYHELPEWYAIADVGSWPKQESTSMIDAAACGLPIVISNRVQAVERVEGNGLTYNEPSSDDLASVLLQLKDAALRKKLGDFGVAKIQSQFSWDKIAKERIEDYARFLK